MVVYTLKTFWASQYTMLGLHAYTDRSILIYRLADAEYTVLCTATHIETVKNNAHTDLTCTAQQPTSLCHQASVCLY